MSALARTLRRLDRKGDVDSFEHKKLQMAADLFLRQINEIIETDFLRVDSAMRPLLELAKEKFGPDFSSDPPPSGAVSAPSLRWSPAKGFQLTKPTAWTKNRRMEGGKLSAPHGSRKNSTFPPDAPEPQPLTLKHRGKDEKRFRPAHLSHPPVDDEDDNALAVPYTTASSVFLYGTNTVIAALRARRRKLYRLYLAGNSSESTPAHAEIRRHADILNLPIQLKASTQLLSKISADRPHNGCVLECSVLPTPPVMSLGRPDAENSDIPITLHSQSSEDAAVNGMPSSIRTVDRQHRRPFVVMLDGITDPGNVGNILRTAHFYGVDAVAIATATCANLTSATLAKASSGACEAIQVLAVSRPSAFVHAAGKEGWNIYAATVEHLESVQKYQRSPHHFNTAHLAASSPLAKGPCLLLLGAEGEGLRENLRRQAHFTVSIDPGRRASDELGSAATNVGVDSVNVATAAGILFEAFMRKPYVGPHLEGLRKGRER